ncbi:MAG: hypothetical protein Q8K93_10715 [Reyranella sp.]|nr:hypothetical protein [Reyranella sp.]
MSNALFRIVGAGTLALGLATVAAAPGFAKDRTYANANGTHTLDRATGGDRAQDRMSARGLASSNGIFMPGRSTGRDRADDRMNRPGIDNSKAGKHADRDARQADRQAKHAVVASTAPGKGQN